MTEPILAAQRFAMGLFLGTLLGVFYGFLHPLRARYPLVSDFLFLPGVGWIWLYFMFGICQGDLRLSGFFALLLGGILWEGTFGKLLRPVFVGFWRFCAGTIRFFLLPFKKILQKTKILFALLGKSVTIKWSNRRMNRRTSGGAPDGRTRKSLSQYPIHRSAGSP